MAADQYKSRNQGGVFACKSNRDSAPEGVADKNCLRYPELFQPFLNPFSVVGGAPAAAVVGGCTRKGRVAEARKVYKYNALSIDCEEFPEGAQRFKAFLPTVEEDDCARVRCWLYRLRAANRWRGKYYCVKWCNIGSRGVHSGILTYWR